MPERLCDPAPFLDAPVLRDQAAVHERIPQRHEMALLNGILHEDFEDRFVVGFHQSSESDFWVRGHVPGRPLMPGVVMVEAAAQLCAYATSYLLEMEEGRIFGFGGLEGTRFRGQVLPGDKLILVSRVLKLRRRTARYATQAFVGDDLVYEGEILGVAI